MARPGERYFNLLCMACSHDDEALSPVMDKKCKFEYNKIKFAFRTLASVAHTF